MARLSLTDLINAINNTIVENSSGNITADVLNNLLENLTNNLYLSEVSTITVNATGGVSSIVFTGGVTVNIVGEEATVTMPAAYRGDAYGDMSITTNESNTVVFTTGQNTASDTLLPITYNTNYFKIPGYSAGTNGGFPYDAAVGGLHATVAGVYKISGWASVRHSANTSSVGVVFGIFRGGALIATSPRPTPTRIPNGGELGLISGEGLVTLEVDDVIVPLVGTDTVGTVTINNSTLVGLLVGV